MRLEIWEATAPSNALSICNYIFSAIWPGDIPLVPHHGLVPDYRRCYSVPSEKGEFLVKIKLNELPAYDCISAMEVSLNVSEGCSRYMMYNVQAAPIVGFTITSCKPTLEYSHDLFSYCQYRCEPAVNLAFRWSGSPRLQSGMTICDLRWNYETC